MRMLQRGQSQHMARQRAHSLRLRTRVLGCLRGFPIISAQTIGFQLSHVHTCPFALCVARFVVLEGASKKEMEELTMELCRTRLPVEKAEKTLEKLQKKRDSTWGKVGAGLRDGVECVLRGKGRLASGHGRLHQNTQDGT